MAEWERHEALRQWLLTFEECIGVAFDEEDYFSDCEPFARLFEFLSGSKAEFAWNKPASRSDWVSVLMNIRHLTGLIFPLLRESGYEPDIDLNRLAENRDQEEEFKLIKYFLLYSVKSKNKKESISRIRTLDKPVQQQISLVLKEFTEKTGVSRENQVDSRKDDEDELEGMKKKEKELENRIKMLEKKSLELAEEDSLLDSPVYAENKRKYALAKIKLDELEQIEREVDQEITLSKLRQHAEETEASVEFDSILQIARNSLNESIQSVTNKLKIPYQPVKEPEQRFEAIKEQILKSLDEKNLEKSLVTMERSYKSLLSQRNALIANLSNLEKTAKRALIKELDRLSSLVSSDDSGEIKDEILKLRVEIAKLTEKAAKLQNKMSDCDEDGLRCQITKIQNKKVEKAHLLHQKLEFIQNIHKDSCLRLQRARMTTESCLQTTRLEAFKKLSKM